MGGGVKSRLYFFPKIPPYEEPLEKIILRLISRRVWTLKGASVQPGQASSAWRTPAPTRTITASLLVYQTMLANRCYIHISTQFSTMLSVVIKTGIG